MKCPYCKQEISETAKFCVKCGLLIPRCPTCNKVIGKGVKYCPYDGTSIPNYNISDVNAKVGKRDGTKGGLQFPLIIMGVVLLALLGLVGFLVYQTFVKPQTPIVVVKPSTTALKQETEEISSGNEAEKSEEDSSGSSAYKTAKQYAPAAESDIIEYNGHAYAIFNFKTLGLGSFDACEEYCENMGGHLAVINSQDENDRLYQLVTDSGLTLAFFGYTDEKSEGNWQWVDGSDNKYTNWCKIKGKTQPNNGAANKGYERENYAEFYKETANGMWNDAIFGMNTYRFICEWE